MNHISKTTPMVLAALFFLASTSSLLWAGGDSEKEQTEYNNTYRDTPADAYRGGTGRDRSKKDWDRRGRGFGPKNWSFDALKNIELSETDKTLLQSLASSLHSMQTVYSAAAKNIQNDSTFTTQHLQQKADRYSYMLDFHNSLLGSLSIEPGSSDASTSTDITTLSDFYNAVGNLSYAGLVEIENSRNDVTQEMMQYYLARFRHHFLSNLEDSVYQLTLERTTVNDDWIALIQNTQESLAAEYGALPHGRRSKFGRGGHRW